MSARRSLVRVRLPIAILVAMVSTCVVALVLPQRSLGGPLDDECLGRQPTLVGTDGPDTLVGTRNADVLAGLGGDDTLIGLEGNDLLCGGAGDDVLAAGDGRDTIDGGDGNDAGHGEIGRDTCVATELSSGCELLGTASVTTTTTTTTVAPTPTTAAPTTTTVAPAPTTTVPAAGAVLWWEDFSQAASMDRLVKEIHAGDPTNFVAQPFNGDHNHDCAGPTTGRQLVEDHQVNTHFWYCAPGGDSAKGHMMTGINTQGYVIMSFAPKDAATGRARVFGTDANQICWDQNMTDLGGRKWNQLMVLSEATFRANNSTISYLNPGNPDNFSAVNPQARPAGDDFTIKFLKQTVEAFRGQTKIYDNFFIAVNGVTDKATRYRQCVTDNGNGTITRTQNRPGGDVSTVTFPGSFPAGNRVFILGDDNYNVMKSYEEGATQFVSDPFTWHWDNLQITSATG